MGARLHFIKEMVPLLKKLGLLDQKESGYVRSRLFEIDKNKGIPKVISDVQVRQKNTVDSKASYESLLTIFANLNNYSKSLLDFIANNKQTFVFSPIFIKEIQAIYQSLLQEFIDELNQDITWQKDVAREFVPVLVRDILVAYLHKLICVCKDNINEHKTFANFEEYHKYEIGFFFSLLGEVNARCFSVNYDSDCKLSLELFSENKIITTIEEENKFKMMPWLEIVKIQDSKARLIMQRLSFLKDRLHGITSDFSIAGADKFKSHLLILKSLNEIISEIGIEQDSINSEVKSLDSSLINRMNEKLSKLQANLNNYDKEIKEAEKPSLFKRLSFALSKKEEEKSTSSHSSIFSHNTVSDYPQLTKKKSAASIVSLFGKKSASEPNIKEDKMENLSNKTKLNRSFSMHQSYDVSLSVKPKTVETAQTKLITEVSKAIKNSYPLLTELCIMLSQTILFDIKDQRKKASLHKN